jgi:hypothetical protein
VNTNEQARPLVLVLTDSMAFVGQQTAHPVDDPRLWPNVMASELNVDVEVFGDFGWTAREAWYALGHNVRLWALMRKADLVVLAVGTFDSAPEPLPSSLWKRIAMIRSPKLRRVVSAAHRRAVPMLAGLLSPLPDGGPVVLRARLTVHFLQGSVLLLRKRRPGLPVLAMTPIPVRPRIYGGFCKGSAKTERAVRGWATAAEIPLLDTSVAVGDHMLSGRGNPDGLHLGWEGHTALGEAFSKLVSEMLPPAGVATKPSTSEGTVPQYGHAARC